MNSFETDKVEPDFEMTIKLVNQQAIFSGPRRLAFSEKKELQKILDILIDHPSKTYLKWESIDCTYMLKNCMLRVYHAEK